jgi:hypothetical protein
VIEADEASLASRLDHNTSLDYLSHEQYIHHPKGIDINDNQ